MADERYYLLVEGDKRKEYVYENKFDSIDKALEHARNIKAVKIRIFDTEKRAVVKEGLFEY